MESLADKPHHLEEHGVRGSALRHSRVEPSILQSCPSFFLNFSLPYLHGFDSSCGFQGRQFPAWAKFSMNPVRLREDKGKGKWEKESHSAPRSPPSLALVGFLPPTTWLCSPGSLPPTETHAHLPPASPLRSSVGGSLMTGWRLNNYLPGIDGGREWPFLSTPYPGPALHGKHSTDMQVDPYTYITIRAT